MNQTSPFTSFERERRRRFDPSPRGRFDPRPESPGQLALAALVVWLIGALVPPLHLMATVGLALLIIATVAYVFRPRPRTMYWRGRQLDLGDPPSPASRLYHVVFKR